MSKEDPIIDNKAFLDLKKKFEEIKERSLDIRKAEPKLKEVLYEDTTKRFQSSPPSLQGGEVYGGVTWKKLSQYTIFMNPRRASGQVLIDSGELQRSVTIEGANGQIFEISPDSFRFGYNLGDKNDLQKDRPIVFVHEELQKKIGETLTEYILGETDENS